MYQAPSALGSRMKRKLSTESALVPAKAEREPISGTNDRRKGYHPPPCFKITKPIDVAARRKRRRSANRPAAKARGPKALQERARQAMEGGRFRDAISHYKALLKSEDSPEARQGLAAAYQGRARELAAKGMLKEALAIGEIRRELCPDEPVDPEHVTLLLRVGGGAEGGRAYRQAEKTLEQQALASLRRGLAALYLSGDSGLEDGLDPDDPVLVQGAVARAALQAYCRGEDTSAARSLAEIPFRSPYRDWVQILKALMKSRADTAGADALLRRITPDSPFAPVAQAARLSLLPDSTFPEALRQASAAAQRFAAALRGWTEARLSLWKELQPLEKRPGTKDLSTAMHRHREVLGEAWVHRQGLRLLIQGFPGSLYDSPLFRAQPSPFLRDLVGAWQAEEEGDRWRVFDAWMDVIRRLREPSDPAPGSDKALRIALIQRRLDTRWHLLDYPAEPYQTEQLSLKTLTQLEESLHFDPDDRPTYTRLIARYRDKKRLKDARRLLDRALQRWPGDVAVLCEALETAVASAAFKKAAGFASRLLELDSINSRARDSLLEAHLAHAHKQIRNGRRDLAERELEAAAEWGRGEKAEAKLGLLRGFLLLDGNPEAGTVELCAMVERMGGGITGRLALAREAARLGREPAGFMKRLGLPQVRRPEKADLLAFLRELRDSLDVGQEIPPQVYACFEAALKRAAELELGQGDCEAACETLHRCGLQKARLAHARAALKRWPGQAVFELHAFEAKHDGVYWAVPDAELRRLEKAHKRAQEGGDMRTAHRIGEHLEHLTYLPSPGSGVPRDVPEEVEELVEDIGIDGLLNFIDIIGAMDPEMKEMERQLGREKMREMLEAMLNGIDPDDVPIDADFVPFRPKTSRKRRKSRRKSGDEDAADDDFPNSDQFDLFE